MKFGVTVGLFFGSFHSRRVLGRLRRRHLRSRLRCLGCRVGPRFFVGALGGVRTLMSVSAKGTGDAVMRLSGLVHCILCRTDGGAVLLGQRIRFLRGCVTVVKLHCASGISVRVGFPVRIPRMRVPPLLFVSFIRGTFGRKIDCQGSSFIHIVIRRRRKGQLAFHYAGDGGKETSRRRRNVKLSGVHGQLELLFNGSCALSVARSGGGFSMLLVVPLLW